MSSSRPIPVRAFSLVELLVVVCIISALLVFAVPALVSSRQMALGVSDLSNLRQIGIAAAAYSVDNDGMLPQSTHQGPGKSWSISLKSYLSGGATFRSPLDSNKQRAYSYAINDFITVHPFGAATLDYSRRVKIDRPGDTLFLALSVPDLGETDHFHFADEGFSPDAFAAEVNAQSYSDQANYLFVDGHAERRSWNAVQAELNRPGSCFINPGGQP